MNRPVLLPCLLLALAGGPAAARTTIEIFDTPRAVNQACDAGIAAAREAAEDIREVPVDQAGADTVLAAWDDLYTAMADRIGPAYLQAYVHPDQAVRDAGQDCINRTTKLETDLYQDPALFRRVQAVAPEAGADKALQAHLLAEFEDSGVALPDERRQRAKTLLQRIEELGQQFQQNLRENDTVLTFGPTEQAGLPDAFIERVPADDEGNLRLKLQYPHYFPFMENATNAEARERFYRAFNNRGGDANLDILEELALLRRELAGLYGFDSYAAFATRRRMVGDPGTVHAFLDRVDNTLAPLQTAELAQLTRLKAEHTGRDEATLAPWDKSFYLTRLRESRYDIDAEAMRRYFPMPAMTDWVLHVAEKLYGLRFVPADVPVWHEDVRYYDVRDRRSDTRLGGLYLDLHPRDGKYGHAAAFGVRGASTRTARKPNSVLVTNFTRSGLTPDELETYLHEIGHALHGVLSTTRYAMLSGTEVELDFVEAPSQMFQAWSYRLESLRTIPEVCPECPPVDADLVERMEASRRAGQALFYGRQWLYAQYDMRLAGPEPVDPMALWRQLESATPLGHVEGTNFPATFGHIAGGYAAGYYGYMWAEALGLDMLSAFNDGLMDPKTGAKFRRAVLARGGERPASEMVRDFLGRETRPDAFFEKLRNKDAASPQ